MIYLTCFFVCFFVFLLSINNYHNVVENKEKKELEKKNCFSSSCDLKEIWIMQLVDHVVEFLI